MTGVGIHGPDHKVGLRGLGLAHRRSHPDALDQRSGLSARAVGAIAALALLCATLAAGRASAQQIQASSTSAARVIERLHVSDDVRVTWDRVVACAGGARDTTKTLEQVVFLLRTPGARLPNGKLMKGQWVAPDTIFITQGYEHSGWIVAHELLHHALNGPPGLPVPGRTEHPLNPFMFPCGLWNDPTADVPDPAESAPTDLMLGGPHFSYPVLGFAVYIQGTLLAGHGWWRA